MSTDSASTSAILRILDGVANRNPGDIIRECAPEMPIRGVIGLLKNDPPGLDFFLQCLDCIPDPSLCAFNKIIDDRTYDVYKRHGIFLTRRGKISLEEWRYMQDVGYILAGADGGSDEGDDGDEGDDEGEDEGDDEGDAEDDEENKTNVAKASIEEKLSNVNAMIATVDTMIATVHQAVYQAVENCAETAVAGSSIPGYDDAGEEVAVAGIAIDNRPADDRHLHEHKTPYLISWVQLGVNTRKQASPDDPVVYYPEWWLTFTFLQAGLITKSMILNPYIKTREEWRKFETCDDIRMLFGMNYHYQLESDGDKYTFMSGVDCTDIMFSVSRECLQPALSAALAEADELGLPFAGPAAASANSLVESVHE